MAFYISQRLVAYVRPSILLAIALYGLHSPPSSLLALTLQTGAFLVLLETITFQSRPKDVLSPNKLSERIFGKVWLRIDEGIAAAELETDVPKLDAKAYGTVLEVGPGSGNQLPRYDTSKIDRIYGVEPNANLHDALRSNIKKHGWSDAYTIVPCGLEDQDKLKEYGIKPESIDTVVSVQVLCSVPRPAALVKDLYRLLKPGGQMVVYEHVKSEDYITHFVQLIYNLVWPYAIGNCHLDRPTEKYLLEAGSWSTIELETPKEEDAWNVLPRVHGRLVKRGAGSI